MKSNSIANLQNHSFRALVTTAFIDQENQDDRTYFQKEQLFAMILSKNLIDTLKIYCSNLDPKNSDNHINSLDRFIICKIIYQVSDTILQYYKKQNLYDQQSLNYLRNGIFQQLINLFEHSERGNMSECEQKYISRCLEFCSTHQEGIKLLYQNKNTIFKYLSEFFKPESDEKSVLYASATVLLDLTANESCLESVALLLKEHQMFDFIIC